MSWGVVVVAGGVCPDELAVRLGTPRKALARFGDVTALEIVLSAVKEADIGPVVTVSGQDVAPYVPHGGLLNETTSAVDNAIAASAMLNTSRLLIIPADMPFVTGPSLRDFTKRLDARIESEKWYAGGLCELSDFRSQFPQWDCSPIHLKQLKMLSGGLFASTPEGLSSGRDLFNSIRRSRKNQFAMVKKFGVGAIFRYFARMMSVADAERRLSHVLQGQVIIDTQAAPDTILDFDNVAEYDRALEIWNAKS